MVCVGAMKGHEQSAVAQVKRATSIRDSKWNFIFDQLLHF